MHIQVPFQINTNQTDDLFVTTYLKTCCTHVPARDAPKAVVPTTNHIANTFLLGVTNNIITIETTYMKNNETIIFNHKDVGVTQYYTCDTKFTRPAEVASGRGYVISTAYSYAKAW